MTKEILHSRRDRSVWRVWREDWPGDVFEILELDEYNNLVQVLKRFNLGIEEHHDD